MSKPLYQMPYDVRHSALCNSSAWYARLLQKVHEYAFYGWFIAVFLAWWVPAYWLLIAPLPFEWSQKSIGFMRAFILTSYAFLLLYAVALHWFEMWMMVPRKDPQYPLVSNQSGNQDTTRDQALHAAGFAGILWLAAYKGWYTYEGTLSSHIPYAIGATVVSLLTFAFWKWPPAFGFNVPSDSDVSVALNYSERSQTASNKAADDEEYEVPVNARTPKLTFKDLFGMASVKAKLLEPARLVIEDREEGKQALQNGILMHGEPGNGKTDFAEALAGELGVPFIQLTYTDVSSKWLGQTPKVLQKTFEYARSQAPCVLFLDEIDGFLPSRDGNLHSEDRRVANTLLTEIVRLRTSKVVLVGATNFLDKLDPAAVREGRFDLKVEITPPDEEARIGLLRAGAKKQAPDAVVDEVGLLSIAGRWNGFSVARLLAVSKEVGKTFKGRPGETIGFDDWTKALREVQGREGKLPASTKLLKDLILPQDTRSSLELIMSRLKDVERIESLGGTLPGGVLFSGPPGTGKTVAAKAIAKESGWSFISVAGPDLVADRDRLAKVFAQAKDLRPAIIFIDEADELLKNRLASATPELTNRMLVLMDGSDEKVKDVVVIAATNNPEMVDPALLRPGRFTEKIRFEAPNQDDIPRHVSEWLKKKRAILQAGLDAFDVAEMLKGSTIASVDGVLQHALNTAIQAHSGEGALVITSESLERAAQVVLAES